MLRAGLSIKAFLFQHSSSRSRGHLPANGKRRLAALKLCGAAMAAMLFATAAAAHQRTFHFEIRQQPLSQALRDYGQICGRDVIFTEDVVAEAGAASLEGDYDAQEALKRLLDGTNLVAERSPSGAVMIRRLHAGSPGSAPSPMTLHKVVYEGPDLREALADTNEPPNDAPSGPAAPSGQSEAGTSPPSRLEEVVVTGSRIARRDY